MTMIDLSSLLETILLSLIEEICLGTSQVDNLWTTISLVVVACVCVCVCVCVRRERERERGHRKVRAQKTKKGVMVESIAIFQSTLATC